MLTFATDIEVVDPFVGQNSNMCIIHLNYKYVDTVVRQMT